MTQDAKRNVLTHLDNVKSMLKCIFEDNARIPDLLPLAMFDTCRAAQIIEEDTGNVPG